MTHILIATDVFTMIIFGLFLLFIVFALGRAAASGQLRARRRRDFYESDDSNLSILGQTGLLDQFTNNGSSSNSSDDLSIFPSTVSPNFNSGENTDLSSWSSGGHFNDSAGGLGDSVGSSLDSGSSFGDSAGGLGDSLGSSFDSGSSDCGSSSE